MKLIRGCLLAVAIFGCLANAQIVKPEGQLHIPRPLLPALSQQTNQQQSNTATKPSNTQTLQSLPNINPSQQFHSLLPIKPSNTQTIQKPRPTNINPSQQFHTLLPNKPSNTQTIQKPRPTNINPSQQFHTLLPNKPLNTQTHKKLSNSKNKGDTWPTEPMPCNVDHNDKIPCGEPSISSSGCLSMGCCHDGQMCHYNRGVTLQCTKGGLIIVVISRDITLPTVTGESIRLFGSGPDCEPKDVTARFLIYEFPVTSCGTMQMDEAGGVIYTNRLYCPIEISSTEKGTITRDTTFVLDLLCNYTNKPYEDLIIEIIPIPPINPVVGIGPMDVWLFLGNGKCTMKGCNEEDVAFNSYEDSEYPITKVLRDPVYVDVQLLDRSDPKLVLTLGNCWVTADQSPHSFPRWDLLKDGCPSVYDNYMTKLLPTSHLTFPGHYKRFVFKMFTFMTSRASDPTKKVQFDSPPLVPSHEQIYIHCNASVCIPTTINTCEARCYGKNRKRRDTDRAVVASAVKTPKSGIVTVSSQRIDVTSV